MDFCPAVQSHRCLEIERSGKGAKRKKEKNEIPHGGWKKRDKNNVSDLVVVLSAIVGFFNVWEKRERERKE